MIAEIIFQSIFFQFIVSCVLPILSGSAATLQLPLVCFKTRNIYSFFFMPLQKAKPNGKIGFTTTSSRFSFVAIMNRDIFPNN